MITTSLSFYGPYPHGSHSHYDEIMSQKDTQLEAGARPPRRALKAITRDRKIQELKERFDTNTITLEGYVQGMSAHTNV